MKINLQEFQIDFIEDFFFELGAESEVQVFLSKPCFANCVLMVEIEVDSDANSLYTKIKKYRLLNENGKGIEVKVDRFLGYKIDQQINDQFESDMAEYFEEQKYQSMIDRAEDARYDY